MIDESILDEIIPVPDADAKMQELKEELAAGRVYHHQVGQWRRLLLADTYLRADTPSSCSGWRGPS